jgi:hypothetical protein
MGFQIGGIMSEENEELSPLEFMLLELTNDTEELHKSEGLKGRLVITSKAVYVWGAVLESLLRHNTDLDEATLLDSLISVCRRNEEDIRLYYEKVNDFKPPFAEIVFSSLFNDLAELFNLPPTAEETAKRVQYVYQSLITKQLVEDPVDILVGGSSIAVLGLLPTGFSCLTKKGRIIKLRYRAALIDVDYHRQRDNQALNIDFRLVRLLSAFKAGLVDGFKNSLGASSDRDSI